MRMLCHGKMQRGELKPGKAQPSTENSFPALPHSQLLIPRPPKKAVEKRKLPVSCRICDYMPDNFKELLSHNHDTEMECANFRCLLCDEQEISRELVQNHINSHKS